MKTRIQVDADEELLALFESLKTKLGCKTRHDAFRELVRKMSAITDLTADGQKVILGILHGALIVYPQPEAVTKQPPTQS